LPLLPLQVLSPAIEAGNRTQVVGDNTNYGETELRLLGIDNTNYGENNGESNRK
jgi:hypothetical protein